jgi:GAF domain-containing protein
VSGDAHKTKGELLAELTALRKRHEEYVAAVHETAAGLLRRLDRDDLLQTIVARAGALVGTPHGYLYLLTPDGAEMEMRVATGAMSRLSRLRIRPGEGVSGQVW